MNRILTGLTAAMLLLAPLSLPAFAQGPAQTAGLMSVDPATVSVGYRASKVVGSNVVDSAGIKLGTVDDLIIVRRQIIWRSLGLGLAEYRPRLWVDVMRRACGAASADAGWFVV